MKKIAGYYRLSMEDDDVSAESNSITNQRLLIRQFISQDAQLKQYEYCEYCDDGYSGTTMNRPGMQEMLQQIRNNEIYTVIVKDISRFSRDYIELGTYMEQIFPFMGIRFISVTDRYDSIAYMGSTANIDIAFKSLLADFYCKDVSAKVKSSLAAKRKQGRYSTGLVPFGYAKDEADPYKLVIVREEAEVVRYIFQLAVCGNSLSQICKRLNDEGIMTPLEYKNLRRKQNRKELQRRVKLWQIGTVRTILMNESYIGNMVYGKTEQTAEGKKLVRPAEEWKIFSNHHEPIVEREVFDAVQPRYRSQKSSVRQSIEYPLKSRLICGYCKRHLKVMKRAGEKMFFYCPSERLSSRVECVNGYVSNERIERIVLSEIKKQLVLLADMDTVFEKLSLWKAEWLKEQEKELRLLDKKVQEMTQQKAACLEAYHRGELRREQFVKKHSELAQRYEELKRRQEAGRRELQRAEADKDSEDCITLECCPGMERLTKEMAEAFVDYIEIDKNADLDIYWSFNAQAACGEACAAAALHQRG